MFPFCSLIPVPRWSAVLCRLVWPLGIAGNACVARALRLSILPYPARGASYSALVGYDSVYKNTTENENIIIIKAYSFALNIQNSDGCYDGYRRFFGLLPFFLVLGPAVVVARVPLWQSSTRATTAGIWCRWRDGARLTSGPFSQVF
jgi:hypothetical protein